MFNCRCGAHWSDELVDEWGTTQETVGYGPDPKCVAIVQDPRTGAGQVCGGRLTHAADSDKVKVTKLHAINVNPR